MFLKDTKSNHKSVSLGEKVVLNNLKSMDHIK